MNLLSIVAFLFAGVVLGYSIFTAGNPKVFLDTHAILIVVGGTVAASAIAFQIDRILLLFKVFLTRVIKGRKANYSTIIADLMKIADAYRVGSPEFEKLVKNSPEHFLREAFSVFTDDVVPASDAMRMLRQRVDTMYRRQMEEVNKFKTIGKYPPAFGLLGTTLSMITLLQKLGEPGGQKLIGPSMALGLVATFYGLAISNLVFGPIAENLGDNGRENRLKNLIILEGVRLIMLKTNPIVLAEELNSFLIPSQRIAWKKGGAAKASRSDKAA